MQRLFFSLKFSAGQQQQLLPYQQQALAICPDAKVVASDNLHLTLFFLGQTDSEQQQRLISSAGQIKLAPFSITLDSLSCFNKPKILYLAPSQTTAVLLQLQQQVAECCHAEGFSDIHDKYRPHITLARHAMLGQSVAVAPLTLNVSEFALYLSDSINGKVRYSPLHIYCLGLV